MFVKYPISKYLGAIECTSYASGGNKEQSPGSFSNGNKESNITASKCQDSILIC